MKQVEVQIMGQAYVLGCPEGGEDRLAQAVAKVDQAMCAIRDSGKLRARDRIAVLAALNLAFDLGDAPKAAEAVETVAPPEDAPAPDSTQEAQDAPEDTRLQSLLQRLNQALAVDGKLI
ncbi:cell division protein ZapA [Comamonas serinivorans]|uniref:Cell division protein ZapA n=1 Tax=Comamonas serinivorans TaxID=1082851 RepID=A0A1Y0EPK4_9BURK|nr:cell division protein ZapA [Comamonas serinivorans]ARU05202.1 cell division protein ZapA [Comamonas serinivorans]